MEVQIDVESQWDWSMLEMVEMQDGEADREVL